MKAFFINAKPVSWIMITQIIFYTRRWQQTTLGRRRSTRECKWPETKYKYYTFFYTPQCLCTSFASSRVYKNVSPEVEMFDTSFDVQFPFFVAWNLDSTITIVHDRKFRVVFFWGNLFFKRQNVLVNCYLTMEVNSRGWQGSLPPIICRLRLNERWLTLTLSGRNSWIEKLTMRFHHQFSWLAALKPQC